MFPAVTHEMAGWEGGGLLTLSLAKSRQQAEEILKIYELFAV